MQLKTVKFDEEGLIKKAKKYQDSMNLENLKGEIEDYAKYLVLKSMKEDPKNDLFDKQPVGSMFHEGYIKLQNNFGSEIAEYFSKHLEEVYEITFPKIALV